MFVFISSQRFISLHTHDSEVQNTWFHERVHLPQLSAQAVEYEQKPLEYVCDQCGLTRCPVWELGCRAEEWGVPLLAFLSSVSSSLPSFILR